MTDLQFIEQNGSLKTNQALTDLAVSLAELKTDVLHLAKKHIDNVSDPEMSEAEKIIWSHQMELFLLDMNIIVTKARVEIHKYKSGGTEQ